MLLRYSSTWAPIHVQHTGAMRAANRNRPDDGKNLNFYAKRMVERLLEQKLLSKDYTKNVIHLSRAVIKSAPGNEIDSQIDSLLQKLRSVGSGPSKLVDELMLLIGRKMASQLAETSETTEELDTNAVAPDKQAENPPISESQQRKRRKFGDFDVPEQLLLREAKTSGEKLKIIRTIAAAIVGRPPAEYSSRLKSCVYNIVNPVMKCLKEHCDNDEEEFIRRWGSNFRHSNWGKRVCPGNSDATGNRCAYSS